MSAIGQRIARAIPNRSTIWRYLIAIRVPALILALLAALFAATTIELVPRPKEITSALLDLFRTNGLLIVAPLCFLENLAPLNTWFPGALAILTAMASTAGNPEAAVTMFGVIWLSSFAGLVASYAIGVAIGPREGVEAATRSRIHWLMPVAVCAHPQTASLHILRLGCSRAVRFKDLLWFAACHFAWSVFWAVTIYSYGLWIYEGSTLWLIIVAYLLIWLALDTIGFVRRTSSAS